MSPAAERLIHAIHRRPTRFVLATSGGGSGAIAQLLEVPGGSRTLLEAAVPYSEPAMAAWLGGRPDQACSEPTARSMAMAAYLRACRYAGEGKGDRHHLCEAPSGPFRQMVPVPFFPRAPWPASLAPRAWLPIGRSAGRTGRTSRSRPAR